MTLYKKTLVIIGVILACLMLALYLLSQFILMEGFSDIEETEAQDNSKRAMNIIADDLGALANASRDWADSIDTYAFVTGTDGDFIVTHVGDEDSWVNNGINAMVFTAADGRVLYSGGFDLREERYMELPDGFLVKAVRARELTEHPEEDCALTGIVALPSGPIMVASVPVTGPTGKVGGNLMWGRYLDEAEISRIAAITLTDVTIARTDDELPQDMAEALERFESGDTTFISKLSDSTLGSYSLIEDIDGNPTMIMRVETERDVYGQGLRSIVYLVITVAGIGIVFGVLVIALVNRFVIRRTRAIIDGVRKVASTGDTSIRFDIKGDDELGKLGADLNHLMESLEESRRSLEWANEDLEERVSEKTMKLNQKLELMEALSDIDGEIISAHNTDSIQELICQRTATLLGAPKVIVVLKDLDGFGHVTSSYGLENEKPRYDELKHLFNPESLAEIGLGEEGAVGFDEVTAYNLFMPELIARENVHSLVVASLRDGNSITGALLVFDIAPRRWSEDEIQVVSLLASQTNLGIDTARLFEDEKIRREELSALYKLSRELADSSPDIETTLSIVSRTAVETVNTSYCRIALLKDDELFMRSAYPRRVLGENLAVGYSEPMNGLAFCQRVLRQDGPVMMRIDQLVLDCHEREVLFQGGAQTLCLVPLKTTNKAIGLMILGEVRNIEREPFSIEKMDLARNIGNQAASAIKRADLISELEQAYMQTVLSLANAVDARDKYTNDHGRLMAHMALAVGRMFNMSPAELDSLHYACMLHDVGKIGVPDSILQKPAELTDREWEQMRRHPSIGEDIMSPVPYLGDASLIVRHHHERFDGNGYPDNLLAEEIPLGSRILSVVDSYCAMRDTRVYKKAKTHEDALDELRNCSGSQFDPRIVKTFARLIESGIINIDNSLNDLGNNVDGDTEAA